MKTTEQPAGASDTEGAQPITFTENVLLDGRDPYADRLVRAGEPSPFRSIDEVPESLRGLVAPAEPLETAGSEERFANYQPNTVYLLNSDGSRGRALRRQVGQLAANASFQEAAEREVEIANKLPRETLEAIQAEHDKHIALQIKAAEVRARNRDAAVIAAQEAAVAGERPAATYHVKRGAVYRKAAEARLRVGETLFQRQPSGDWWAAGQVDSNGALPPPPEVI